MKGIKKHWPPKASKRAEVARIRGTFANARRVPEYWAGYEFSRTRMGALEELPTFRLSYLVGMFGRPQRAMEFLTLIETPLTGVASEAEQVEPSAPSEPIPSAPLPAVGQITLTHDEVAFMANCVGFTLASIRQEPLEAIEYMLRIHNLGNAFPDVPGTAAKKIVELLDDLNELRDQG